MAFVSCIGFSGPVAFRARGCSLALAGMAPVSGVTLAVQAGMGPVSGSPLITLVDAGTGAIGGGNRGAPAGRGSDLLSARLVPSSAVATPGKRKAIFACRATGLDGDDYPQRDLEVKVSQVSP
jgi:hypothetical protein